MQEDIENYVKYSLNGASIKIRTGVIPLFFVCQEERTNTESTVSRPDYLKLNRRKEIDVILYLDEANKDVDDSIATTNQPKKKRLEVENASVANTVSINESNGK